MTGLNVFMADAIPVFFTLSAAVAAMWVVDTALNALQRRRAGR